MKKLIRLLPLLALLATAGFLFMQLNDSKAIAPSEDWRGKPFPEFRLPNLLDDKAILSKASLPKEPFILNVWASWCTWCIQEFPILFKLKQAGVPLVGLTYSDKPADARQALQQWGNPFDLVIDDFAHDFLITTLKVQAAPTSYLIDKNGVIRYQQRGYNPDFEQDFLLRLQQLREEN